MRWKDIVNRFKTKIKSNDNYKKLTLNSDIKRVNKLAQNINKDVSYYDLAIREYNESLLRIAPEFKTFSHTAYTKRINDKLSDIEYLRIKYKQKRITFKEFDVAFQNKIAEIDSFHREITKLKGNDNYSTSLMRSLLNDMWEQVFYMYFDEETYEILGKVNNGRGVMFFSATKEQRMKVAIKAYENGFFNDLPIDLYLDRSEQIFQELDTAHEQKAQERAKRKAEKENKKR